MSTPSTTPPLGPRPQIPSWLWIVATNALLAVGVLLWHWPAGNALLLFWVENALLGAVTLAMILTAQGAAPVKIPKRNLARGATALFFCFHYGLFCAVHLMFVVPLSMSAGLEPSWWFLGFPALLVAVRYLAEFASTWILRGERNHVHFLDCFGRPYPRVVVLHIVTLLGWFLMFGLTFAGMRGGLLPGAGRSSAALPGVVEGVFAALARWGVTNPLGVALVLLLVTIKTVMEIGTTSGRWRMSIDDANSGSD